MGLFRVILSTCLLAIVLRADGLKGQWTAEVESSHGNFLKTTFDLDEEDGLVTGTLRNSEGEATIKSGFLDGDTVTFSIIRDVDGYQSTEHYRGTLEDDVIHFSLSVEDRRPKDHRSRDFEAKRIAPAN